MITKSGSLATTTRTRRPSTYIFQWTRARPNVQAQRAVARLSLSTPSHRSRLDASCGRQNLDDYCRAMVDDELATLLAEQVAYYRARAPEYLDGALHAPGGDELEAALDAFAPRARPRAGG